jgi:hypothetical protein
MPNDVTLETFAPHLGGSFIVRLPGGERMAVVLLAADPAPGDDDARRTRAPFSLIFRMPQGRSLAQGMYVVEREGLGAIDIFLVPVVPDRDGPRLQAVFA